MATLGHRNLLVAALAIVVAARASHGAHSGWRRPSSTSHVPQRPLMNSFGKNSHSTTTTSPSLFSIRGGADVVGEEVDDEEALQKQRQEEYDKLVKYRTEQQMLYQLRSTYLTEMLAARGVPLPTITSVSTADGEKPPERVDWDCALSTDDEPKSCLYSFDAEPNTKVVAPLGTTQWISLSALNRLRRTDPTKVEPMWHSQYAVLQSWFSEASEYSLLQHVGVKGFFISSVLLDGGNGMVLRSLLILSVLSVLIMFMPVIEYIVGRIIVSAPFWGQWKTWGRVARAGFPLKLLIGQMVWKGVASAFGRLENEVREYIVDLECEILEEGVPVTVGAGAEEDGDDDVEEETDMEDETDMDVVVSDDEYDLDEYDEYDDDY